MTADHDGKSFDTHEPKTDLARALEQGDDTVVGRRGIPDDEVDQPWQQTRRTARGSLAGAIDVSGDWDSTTTNEAIARDFGLAT